MNRGRSARRQAGVTFIALLVFVALTGFGLASAGRWWAAESQREKEVELLFVGNQFRNAIASYQKTSPGAPEYPRTFEDLLEDRRLPTIRRHLRRLFVDPMTGATDWRPIVEGGRIIGVRSRSMLKPMRTRGLVPADDEMLAGAATLGDWRFVAAAPGKAPQATSAAPPPMASPDTAGPIVPLPDAPVPPPAQAPATPVNRDTRCADQRATDIANCAAARTETTSTADFVSCIASASARDLACQMRRDLPPLALPRAR
jgi:type II secretory pathway pseudopilin PulG